MRDYTPVGLGQATKAVRESTYSLNSKWGWKKPCYNFYEPERCQGCTRDCLYKYRSFKKKKSV